MDHINNQQNLHNHQDPQKNPPQDQQQIELENPIKVTFDEDRVECMTEAKKLRSNMDVTPRNYTHGLLRGSSITIKTGYHAIIPENKNIVTNGVKFIVQENDTVVYGDGTRLRNYVIEIDGDVLMEDFTQGREGVLHTRNGNQKFRHVGGKKIKFPIGTKVTFYRGGNMIGRIDAIEEEITCVTCDTVQ